MGATDQEIVQAVLAGEQHQFGELVGRYQRSIVNYVYRMVGNYDDAVDLSQDVFVKAYTALDSYQPKYPFSAWLFRIARNATIDEIRRRRLTTVPMDEPMETSDGSMTREFEGDDPGPEQLFLEGEFKAEIESAVAELPDKYREPLVLRHAAEMSYDEIAEALELPLGTVKTRIFRAREALRQSLGDILELPSETSQ
jgi:RNA polymerase sigma factor (sigma-70 family)